MFLIMSTFDNQYLDDILDVLYIYFQKYSLKIDSTNEKKSFTQITGAGKKKLVKECYFELPNIIINIYMEI